MPITSPQLDRRYFTTYSGTSLPLKLLNELDHESLENRITYFTAYFDEQERLRVIEKVVYGEIEFSHHYEYRNDNLIQATLTEEGEEPRIMMFDQTNQVQEAPD